MKWNFTFYGEPVPKARAKAFYDPKTHRGWKYEPKSSRDFSNAMKQAMAKEWGKPLIEGKSIEIIINVYRSRPKSLSKKIEHPLKRPDLDNYMKMIFDCLIGTVIKDDSIIVSMKAKKEFSDRPRIDLELNCADAKTISI